MKPAVVYGRSMSLSGGNFMFIDGETEIRITVVFPFRDKAPSLDLPQQVECMLARLAVLNMNYFSSTLQSWKTTPISSELGRKYWNSLQHTGKILCIALTSERSCIFIYHIFPIEKYIKYNIRNRYINLFIPYHLQTDNHRQHTAVNSL